jgi:phosphatidylethanolamine/phosphatidyl-N-methylethanolamine N-methyltransferase
MTMTTLQVGDRQTGLTRSRYDRLAPLYDAIQWPMERRARGWRQQLWSRVAGDRILELGIGTGSNLPFHPPGKTIIGVDLSPRMLERARRRAERVRAPLQLVEGDVQELPFADGSFDSVVATFLFCSVPDPVRGLSEARRVLVSGGQLLLLEHVLTKQRALRWVMRRLDRLTVRFSGAHLDRNTVDNVRAAGFGEVREHDLMFDIVKAIEARRGVTRAVMSIG